MTLPIKKKTSVQQLALQRAELPVDLPRHHTSLADAIAPMFLTSSQEMIY
jgi:hypothetical protein